MLRSLFAIVVFLLCADVLADRHQLAKSWLATTVSDAAECPNNFADDKEKPLGLATKSAFISPPYFIATAITNQQHVYGPQRNFRSAPIRAPPRSR